MITPLTLCLLPHGHWGSTACYVAETCSRPCAHNPHLPTHRGIGYSFTACSLKNKLLEQAVWMRRDRTRRMRQELGVRSGD